MPVRSRLWVMSLLFVLAPALVLACSVPVFRYALDHWPPDAYRLYVYLEDAPTAEDQKLLDWLAEQQQAGANLHVQMFNLTETLEPADQARWERLNKSQSDSPRVIVELPARSSPLAAGALAPVGSGEWNADELQQLLNSPAREELAKRLLDGEVVWVFLDSGKTAIDDALFEVLNQQIQENQATLKLPELNEDDKAELGTAPEELKIRFTSLRIARDDPAEKWFIDMLLSVESDLRDEDVIEQPMVFPVFGRGRALYALVGQGIAVETIRQAAVFLTGACQCTVKAENPGVDLLMPVRWGDFIQITPDEVDVPLIGLGGGSPSMADSPTVAANLNSTDVPEPATTTAASPEKSTSNRTDTSSTVSRLSIQRESGGSTVLWLPMLVLIVVAPLVGFMGLSILRRQ